MSVFLSYAKSDQKVAERLRTELERQGVSVWWDQSLKPGERWRQQIEEAIRSADDILILVGSRNGRDDAQEFTWRAALEAVWRDRHQRLIPVLLGDAELPPFVHGDSSEETPVTRIHDSSDLPKAARSLRAVLQRTLQNDYSDESSSPENPPVTKAAYLAEADLERSRRLLEVKQYAESLKH